MHEISLTRSLIDIVGEYARREGFSRVNVLKLSFGRLSCLDPGALEFTFAIQARGTEAEGARLEFDIRPALRHLPQLREGIGLRWPFRGHLPPLREFRESSCRVGRKS